MRLINTSTLRLEEFHGANVPPFAILSHRWTNDEVTLQQLSESDETVHERLGYTKIKQCCSQAAKEGLLYVWVDTCCIDKTSSAELTEAINAMYTWYSNAKVCYVHLQDVASSDISENASFEKSTWFTRAWTLQELIAPANVVFYNATWQQLGAKKDLKSTLSKITSITENVLDSGDFRKLSVAQRMSWAVNRTATREEDIAYSLLGIFNINMPLLYGEGQRAFIRLQEEIIKQSNDQSIFAWSSENTNYRGGMLASSPLQFRNCDRIVASEEQWYHEPYLITNKGLSIKLCLVPWGIETYMAALDCEQGGVPDSRIGIFLQLTDEKGQFIRISAPSASVQPFNSLLSETTSRQVFVRQTESFLPSEDRIYGFWLKTIPGEAGELQGPDGCSILTEIHDVLTRQGQWSDTDRIAKMPAGEIGTVAALFLETHFRLDRSPSSYLLKFGFDFDFNPVVHVDNWPTPGMHHLRDEWMHGNPRAQPLTGDRQRGAITENAFHVLKISDEKVGNRRIWAVEFYQQGDKSVHNVACSRCCKVIRGIRYQCEQCRNIDFCEDCAKSRSAARHDDHGWRRLQMCDGSSVELK